MFCWKRFHLGCYNAWVLIEACVLLHAVNAKWCNYKTNNFYAICSNIFHLYYFWGIPKYFKILIRHFFRYIPWRYRSLYSVLKFMSSSVCTLPTFGLHETAGSRVVIFVAVAFSYPIREVFRTLFSNKKISEKLKFFGKSGIFTTLAGGHDSPVKWVCAVLAPSIFSDGGLYLWTGLQFLTGVIFFRSGATNCSP